MVLRLFKIPGLSETYLVSVAKLYLVQCLLETDKSNEIDSIKDSLNDSQTPFKQFALMFQLSTNVSSLQDAFKL